MQKGVCSRVHWKVSERMDFKKLTWCGMLCLTAGCLGRGPNTARMEPDDLFQHAMSAYQNRKWTQAAEAFERFTLQFPTNPRAEEARYRLADSYFGKKEYITAATEFARLASDFPAGNWADDARFKVCESYVKLSPKAQLDQQYTQAAFDHCQSLEAFYPNSEHIPKAQQYSAEMASRLAEKQFRAGEHYFKRGAVDPAIIYYEEILKAYPATPFAPRALLRMFQAYTTLGYKEEADAAKARLLKDYPESTEAKGVLAAPVAKSL
jgi:outer membrane protein assembly factor BamD